MSSATSIDQQIALYEELLDIAAEDFYNIGLSLPAPGYYVVQNNLHNVPETVQQGWMYPGPAPINFETFFIAES
jgi:peptide/nickel transport system substrate-binding protein